MAAIKIAQLTNQLTLSDTDSVIVETATSTNKMTVLKLKELLGISKGGVEDSGSNPDGAFVRYADGTMICTVTKVVTARANLSENFSSILFPSGFSIVPSVSISISNVSSTWNFTVGMLAMIPFTSNYAIRCNVNTAQNYTMSIIAIGRWK